MAAVWQWPLSGWEGARAPLLQLLLLLSCCCSSCSRSGREPQPSLGLPTTSPAPSRSCSATMALRPPAPLPTGGIRGCFSNFQPPQPPLRMLRDLETEAGQSPLGCIHVNTISIFLEQNYFYTALSQSIYTKCVLQDLGDNVEHFCYTLYVNTQYVSFHIYLCLWENSSTVFLSSGTCSILVLVCSQPWKAGTRTCHEVAISYPETKPHIQMFMKRIPCQTQNSLRYSVSFQHSRV